MLRGSWSFSSLFLVFPVFVKHAWLPLRCSLSHPASGKSSSLQHPLSSDFFSHPHLIFIQEKHNKFLPLARVELLSLPRALGLRLYPSPWLGNGSGVRRTVYLPAFQKAHFPHQGSFVLGELGASCWDNKNFSSLYMQIIIIQAIKMMCDKERNNKVLWE